MSPLTQRITSLLAFARQSAQNDTASTADAQRASNAQAALIAASVTANASPRRPTAS